MSQISNFTVVESCKAIVWDKKDAPMVTWIVKALKVQISYSETYTIQKSIMFLLPWTLDRTGHEQIEEQCNFSQHRNHLTAPTADIKNKMSAKDQIFLFFCSTLLKHTNVILNKEENIVCAHTD